eukprot:m.397019 g.397019  ORF g.397019 m.397019 type:complete len:65 (-) comp21119_c1_seq2:321-515(-)
MFVLIVLPSIRRIGAVRRLVKKPMGAFLVRVIDEEEAKRIPGKYHNGSLGNYAISMKINTKVGH